MANTPDKIVNEVVEVSDYERMQLTETMRPETLLNWLMTTLSEQNTDDTSAYFVTCLAEMIGPEETLKRVCELSLMIHHRKKRPLLESLGSRDSWEKDQIIKRFQSLDRRLGGRLPSFEAYFITNYGAKDYKKNSQGFDEDAKQLELEHRVFIEEIKLDLSLVKNILPKSSPRMISWIYDYLSWQILAGILVEETKETLESLKKNLNSPDAICYIFHLVQNRKDNPKWITDVARKFIEKSGENFVALFAAYHAMKGFAVVNFGNDNLMMDEFFKTEFSRSRAAKHFASALTNYPKPFVREFVEEFLPDSVRKELALIGERVDRARTTVRTAIRQNLGKTKFGKVEASDPQNDERTAELETRREKNRQHEKFVEAVSSKLRNFKPRSGVTTTLEFVRLEFASDIAALARDPELLQSLWGNESVKERKITCEDDSFLRLLGIKEVVFKKTGSFSAELIFDDDFKYDQIHIADDGTTQMPPIPEPNSWATQVIKIELLRLLSKMVGLDEREECNLQSIRILLGLDKYDPAAYLDSKDGRKNEGEKGENVKEITSTEDPNAVTERLFAANSDLYERFLNMAENAGLDTPFDFGELLNLVVQLQRGIERNKAIPPACPPVIPPKDHLLGTLVQQIDFHSLGESKLQLRSRKINPALFHLGADRLNEDGEMDAYLANVKINLGGGETGDLLACVIPPNFDTYIIGVDPDHMLELDDKLALALHHSILICFRTAVMRTDKPGETSWHIPGDSGSSESAKDAGTSLDPITHPSSTTYPPLVAEWSPLSPSTSHDQVQLRSSGGRSSFLNNLFYKMSLTEAPAEEMFAAFGMMLPADIFLNVLPHKRHLFPNDAFDSRGALKQVYAKKNVPLDPTDVADLFTSLRNRKLISGGPAEYPDAQTWFNETCKSMPKKKPEAIFAEAVCSGRLRLNMSFLSRLSALRLSKAYQTESRSMNDLYTLFYKRLKEKTSKVLNRQVGDDELFSAMAEMSEIDPKRIFLKADGHAIKRLPYEFRFGPSENEDMPEEMIFDSPDALELPPDTSIQVAKIIAGNRARFSKISAAWLRGQFRTAETNWVAEMQNRHPSWKEIDLRPKARALLVWQFADNTHAFAYLDSTRDSEVHGETLKIAMSAAEKLQYMRDVRDAMNSAARENASGVHTDFSDFSRWNTRKGRHALELLESIGAVQLKKEKGKIIGIHSSKEVVRKKVAIFTEEQTGYRQSRMRPVTLRDYQKFLMEEGGDPIPGLNQNPDLVKIMDCIYDELNLVS